MPLMLLLACAGFGFHCSSVFTFEISHDFVTAGLVCAYSPLSRLHCSDSVLGPALAVCAASKRISPPPGNVYSGCRLWCCPGKCHRLLGDRGEMAY